MARQQRKLPEDPMVRQLVLQAKKAQLSRRGLLAAGGAGTAALTLAACSTGGGGESEALTPAEDVSATDPSLVWGNWPAYIDEDEDGNYPTLLRFIEESGIDVTFLSDINDNNTFYAKIRDQLALGQDIGYDVITPTEWMVSRLVRLGYVQPMNHDNMPNVAANLDDAYRTRDFDPDRTLSLPWQGGFAGICWNKTEVPEGITSVSDLWDPKFKGKVGVLSEMRDTIGCIMLDQGVDISGDWGDAEFDAALQVFSDNTTSGQIRNIKGNDYLTDLENGDTLVAIVWSGDIVTLNAEVGDNWEFAIPEGGATLWNDNFTVPMGSTKLGNVEKLIDYYYDPVVAAEVAAWVNYITPVKGAQEAVMDIDPELAENQLIFPSAETLAKTRAFRTLNGTEESTYQEAFQRVIEGV